MNLLQLAPSRISRYATGDLLGAKIGTLGYRLTIVRVFMSNSTDAMNVSFNLRHDEDRSGGIVILV